MSTGMPVIVSDVGSTYELVKNNGVLVNNNIDDIKKAIQNCIDNYDKYSENSLKLFNECFDLEKHRDQYLNYYQTIVNSEA